jgi:uncharacterized protein YegP (UPF0339 family)
MTRAAQVAHAVTALREAREADSELSKVTSMTFRVFEDNGGRYHWTIVDGGETLAQSASFGSYAEAEQAARVVQERASSASLGDNRPSDLPAHSDAATTRDRLDAKRWLDEGGSFNGQAVTR